MEIVLKDILDAMGNYHFLILFFASLVISFFLLKGRRKILLIPATLMSIVILNPLFYEKWTEVNDYAYWRTLWVVPIIPVCAVLPAALVDRAKYNWMKSGSVVISVVLIIFLGRFIYTYDNPDTPAYSSSNTTFSIATNADKLPEDVVRIEEALLELDDSPSVVADPEISIYHRQFTGRIRTPYSREISYGTPSALALELYQSLTEGYFQTTAQLMVNYDYEYLVVENSNIDRRRGVEKANFELIKQVNGYGIYRVHEKKTELREYNSLHQVIRMTYLDEQGNPINGPDGYARICNEYTKNGELLLTYYYDKEGRIIQAGSGYFHEYLQSLIGRDIVIFIAAKDEATDGLTSQLVDDMSALGIKTDLRGKHRNSYYAVISSKGVVEEVNANAIKYNERIDNVDFTIKSAGYLVGNYASIVINGVEYAKNVRGLNIVIMEHGEIIETIAFDTYTQKMNVSR